MRSSSSSLARFRIAGARRARRPGSAVPLPVRDHGQGAAGHHPLTGLNHAQNGRVKTPGHSRGHYLQKGGQYKPSTWYFSFSSVRTMEALSRATYRSSLYEIHVQSASNIRRLLGTGGTPHLVLRGCTPASFQRFNLVRCLKVVQGRKGAESDTGGSEGGVRRPPGMRVGPAPCLHGLDHRGGRHVGPDRATHDARLRAALADRRPEGSPGRQPLP